MAIKIPIVVTADTKKLTGVTKGLDQLGKAATMALAAVAADSETPNNAAHIRPLVCRILLIIICIC